MSNDKKGGQPEMTEERKHFIEVAQRRVNKALAIIRSLEDCTSKNYEYTKEDVQNIYNALTDCSLKTREIMLNPEKKESGFKL